MDETQASPTGAVGMFEPLRAPVFRNIWLASLLSNLSFMVLSVSAAWHMTQLTPRAELVAMVQSAITLPLMLLSLPAGAVADMYDRRRVSLVSLSVAFIFAAGLVLLTLLDLVTPWILLSACSLIGAGLAMFTPSWQASVGEQVPRRVLPQAIALNAICFNIARSFGPAIGGAVLTFGGAVTAFGLTAVGYLPLILVLFAWKRVPQPARLPPERIDRAVAAGVRFVLHSPPFRTVAIRAFLFGFAGCVISALLPLVVRHVLHGTADVFGFLLGCFGIGAVIGAMVLGPLRQRLSGEATLAVSALLMAASMVALAISTVPVVSGAMLVIGGIGWMTGVTLCNVLFQTSAPRWVTGRLVAAFQASMAGGIAVGSWFWGFATQSFGVQAALICAAVLMVALLVLGIPLRIPNIEERENKPVEQDDVEVNLALTGRSGPIVVEMEYHVAADRARSFYASMLKVRSARSRNGAFAWSLARDISAPELWVERFTCPTWHDYLRQRDRLTSDEAQIHQDAAAHMRSGQPPVIRRLLERPFGSVRPSDNTPDEEVLP